MNTFIKTVEKSISFINQFSEFAVETKLNDSTEIGSNSEVTFNVYPVAYDMFSQVVLSILIDVCHRFGLSYFVSYDPIKNKPRFVMYTAYDVNLTSSDKG